MLDMTFLTISNLSHEYGRNGNSYQILQNVNCRFDKGKIHIILGPSGCGKTTLLNIIAGLIKPIEGEVLLEGSLITSPTSKIGVVFQDLRLFPWLKTKDNVAFGLKIKKESNIEKKVNKYLKLVGLAKYQEYYPFELSGGMKQRLTIARSLVLEPKILLLDEPFGSLDVKTRRKMQDFLLKLHQKLSTTILFVTHDVDEAVRLGDKIYIMSGTPAKIVKVITNKKRFTSAAQEAKKIHNLKTRIYQLIQI